MFICICGESAARLRGALRVCVRRGGERECFRLLGLVRVGQRYRGLEQVAVHCDGERSALQFGKALGNGKAQAAALGVAGTVAPHKAVGDLFRAEIQLGGGNVFEHHLRAVLLRHQRDISPGAGHAVFGDVHHQVLKDAAGLLPVQHQRHAFLRELPAEIDAAGFGFVGQLVLDLLEQCGQIYFSVMHGHVPCGGLAHLKQVLDQPLEPLGFFVQRFNVFGPVFGRKGGVLEQVHIGDDGGQRRFQVV